MKHLNYLFRHNRRKFLKDISLAFGATALGMPLVSMATGPAAGAAEKEQQAGQWGTRKRKLGIALVGLGNYATNQLAPALQETEKCYLAGIVTGTPSKAAAWKRKYNIPDQNIYNYETYDQIADNPDIDIIYVVLPNAMHAEYTVRGAQAGKHMISEKPMATSVADCQRMIEACNKSNVKLSIGYRLHFEPHNLRVMELGQQQVYGPVQRIEAADSFVMSGNPDRWRLDKKLAGGGPLMDLGIYCVQGAIYTMGQTPTAVTAKFGEVTRPDFFDEVEQSIDWQMEFPNGAVADCTTSYNKDQNLLYGKADKGWWRLQPAYSYSGIQGETSAGPMNLSNVNQQARQMDAFAECILENKTTRVPGEMGLRDVRILEAIYEAARTGKRVEIKV
ncbi:Gfo/Idh/MocA family protein [Pontibacter actiniarum]|uniref:Glucose-fructose oxidoreductase n=1 Tax=Pontibacter actiniarum TaxID=323450 RepID=A0A1X9YPW1_9BACT|nr:Gfo/Idh/MocA family oxidoreductase [Pontibacter actiniarum]ARS34928.1 glucose-fructose oxidoreductase [Pontibacter actiniarum]